MSSPSPPMRGLEMTRTANAEFHGVKGCADTEIASQIQPLLGPTAAVLRDIDTAAAPTTDLRLPPELRLLFAIGGASMALPMTALLFLVNTRTPLPVSLLPAYGALCFLPYSIKPVLALLTRLLHDRVIEEDHRKQHGQRQSPLLPVLLLLHAAALVATSCWADTRIGLFAVGFLRGLTSAWTEFLLELQVLHHVLAYDAAATAVTTGAPRAEVPQRTPPATGAAPGSKQRPPPDDCSRAATRLQAQAATARNLGSWSGHLLATLWLLVEEPGDPSDRSAMTAGAAARLLHVTALLNVMGGVLVWRCRRAGAPDPRRSDTMESHEYIFRTEPLSAPSSQLRQPVATAEGSGSPAGERHDVDGAREAVISITRHNTMNNRMKATCLLQCFVILLVFRDPWRDSRAAWLWFLLVGLAMLILLWETVKFVAASSQLSKQESIQYRAGLCLILRNAMPTASYLLASYVYGLFESHPVDIQILTLVDMGVLTLGSWSFGLVYGNALATNTASKKADSQYGLYRIMIVTTIIATFVALIGQLVLIKLTPSLSASNAKQLAIVIVIQSLRTIFGEWKFLPEVILATVASLLQFDPQEMETSSLGQTSHETLFRSESSPEQSHEHTTDSKSKRLENYNWRDSTDMCYGSLTSCVDLGSQISTIIVSMLVDTLRISRENNWKSLDYLVEIEALGSLLSIAWIYLLLRPNSIV